MLSDAETAKFSTQVPARAVLGLLYKFTPPESAYNDTIRLVKFLTGLDELPDDLFELFQYEDAEVDRHPLLRACVAEIQQQLDEDFRRVEMPRSISSGTSEAWLTYQLTQCEEAYEVIPMLVPGAVYELSGPTNLGVSPPRYELVGLAHYMTDGKKRDGTKVVCRTLSLGSLLIWSLDDFLGEVAPVVDQLTRAQSDPAADWGPVRRFHYMLEQPRH